jgi:hypothetical protein
VYGGVVGRTHAYRFEKGEVNLSLEAFLTVLDNLQMESPDEFFFLHYGEPYRNKRKFMAEVESFVTYPTDEPEFYLKYKDSKNREERFFAYLIHLSAIVERHIYEENSLNIEEIVYMKNYLLRMETWTKYEMDAASTLIPVLPDVIRPMFLERFRHNYQKYKNYEQRWAEEYAGHLLNYSLVQAVYFKRFDESIELLPELQQLMIEYPYLEGMLYISMRVRLLTLIEGVLKGDDAFVESETERINLITKFSFNSSKTHDWYKEIIENVVGDVREYVKDK